MIWVGTNNGGSLLKDDAAFVHVNDRGFTVGEGVFETIAVHDGHPFALNRHLARLIRSAEILDLPEPNLEVIRDAVTKVITANMEDIGDLGRLRVTFTAGIDPNVPSIVVTCVSQRQWDDSTTVVTVPWVRNERSSIVGAKCTSYAENTKALKLAHKQGASEAILANTVGNLCEGTTSNVFVVIDDQIVTPPLSSGCLPGVTRELVIRWYDVTERDIPYSEVSDIEEMFLTSTTRGVHPVSSLDGRSLRLGSISHEVRSSFIEHRNKDVNP